jgi:hypothetical protein
LRSHFLSNFSKIFIINRFCKDKKSQEKKSQYIFSTFTIPRKVTVCITSDFVHTQVMVFIATFKICSVTFCFIITIYFKFGFILINNNIWSAHTVHTYYLITRTNINLIFELCKLVTGKQIGTPSASQNGNIYFPHNFSNFSIFVDFPTS